MCPTMDVEVVFHDEAKSSEMSLQSVVRLRQLLAGPDIVVIPFAYDAFSALSIEQAGFDAIGVTGSGLVQSLLGLPDVGLVTMTEMADQLRNIAGAVNIPVITDADDGYGNALNVMRTVREFERAGVAGLFFEDLDVSRRRAGLPGKPIISEEEMVLKIRAALEAREGPDFVIIARTDARSRYGLEEAIRRGRAYAAAGADGIFVEAPRSVEELRQLPAAIPAPLMVSMSEGGKTPLLSVTELAEMGFKIVTYPLSLARAGAWAMRNVLNELKETGTTQVVAGRMMSSQERNAILGLGRVQALESRFLPLTGEEGRE